MRHLLPKCLLATTGAVALSALGLLATSARSAMEPIQLPKNAPVFAEANDELVFHGSVEQSYRQDWSEVQKYGVYSFTLDSEPKAEGPLSTVRTDRGGFFHDNKYYCISSAYDSASKEYYGLLRAFDTGTWKQLSCVETVGNTIAMAYDYSQSKAYAITSVASDNYARLLEVNLTDGSTTEIAKVGRRFPAIAFDANGQLYGISREFPFPYKTALCKINKTTGEVTEVGPTGYNQKSDYCAATFDIRTGKLYWTTRTFTYDQYYQETYDTLFAEIDLTTGKATKLKSHKEEEIFSSLYIMDSHPKAPAKIDNLAYVYSEGKNNEGKITFNFPTKYYDTTALPSAAKMKCELYLNGSRINDRSANGTFTPGQKFESALPVKLADGKNTIEVYLTIEGLENERSVANYIKVYGGADVPSPVTNVKTEYSAHRETVTITWDAPTTAANGGAFDPAGITYKVLRAPGLDVVAENLKECRFTDTPDYVQTFSQYRIIAVSKNGESQPAYTEAAIIGQPSPMPYVQTFDSQMAFNTFTIIDPQGIGCADGDTWFWFQQDRNAIYFLNYAYYNAVNSWLVTPTLKFKDDYLYRLTFTTHCYAGVEVTKRYEIALGEFPTEESLKRVVHGETFVQTGSNPDKDFSILFQGKASDYHIGFHAIGDGSDHFSIDNIRVTEYGPATVPAAPELISITKDNDQVTATVKVPTSNALGNPVSKVTKMRMYSEGRKKLIDVVDVAADASQVSLVDTKPTFGLNNYVIVAENESGSGLELACSINMKPDVPKPVENYTLATATDGKNALLKWDYAEDMLGVDGHELAPEEISYDIYQGEGYGKMLVQTVPGTQTELLLPDVMGSSAERQAYITYTIIARTLGGESTPVSQTALFGAAYEMPIYENFSGATIKPWDTSRSQRGSFSSGSPTAYDPRCSATDGNVLSFMPSYDSQAVGVYVSPRINLTGLKNPKMTYSVFCSPDANLANATVQIGVIIEKDGFEQEMELIPGVTKVQADQEGWKEFEVDLKKFNDCPRASVVLRVLADKRKGRVNFDYIKITGEKPDYDARLVKVSGPYTAMIGRENSYTVTVDNNGKNDLDNVLVTFLADGKEIANKTVHLSEGESLPINFTYVPELDEKERNIEISATVKVDGDQNTYNDFYRMNVQVEAPNLPYVTDLDAISEDGKIHLFWSDATLYPHEKAETDDLEQYPDFTIDNFGKWTMHDLDKAITTNGLQSSIGTFTWENVGKPQAYIIFNPTKVGVQTLTTAHSGDRCLVSFPCATVNNDWLVSPALSGHEQTISFYTKALYGSQFTEVYSVMISRAGTAPEDFTPLKEDININNEGWVKVSYNLPAGTRHFAIVCKSNNAFGFMLDDFEFVPAQPDVELTGYNVYRDRVLLAEGLGETEHFDTDFDKSKDYTYHVTATYTDGESIFSNPVTVNYNSVGGPISDEAAVYSQPGTIIVKCPAGSPVTVHTLDGLCLYSFASTGIESMKVPAGIYIVRAGAATAKLIVK